MARTTAAHTPAASPLGVLSAADGAAEAASMRTEPPKASAKSASVPAPGVPSADGGAGSASGGRTGARAASSWRTISPSAAPVAAV